MRRWAQLFFSLAVLAPTVHAAEVELTIARSEPEWLLPPAGIGPCGMPGGFRLESCPMQVYPEGIALVGEESLVLEITPLIAAENHEAVLARVGLNYGIELALLEAGDVEGFLRTRVPVAGPQIMPNFAQFPVQGGGEQRSMDTSEAETRNLRPAPTPNPFAGRRGVGTGNNPDFISAPVLYLTGHSYFSLQRYEAAEAAFKLAIVAIPDHVRAHESLGMLYLRAERYEDARGYLSRAVDLGRNTAHIFSALGYLEQKASHYLAAASAFQRVLVLEPENRTALRGLMLALTETGEHAKARTLVEQLLKAEPDDIDLWRYRAQIALSANDRPSALASLEAALRLGDDSAANRRTCVALHMENGNIGRAVDLLQGSARGLEFALVDRALGWLANENDWVRFRRLLASVDRAALGGAEQSRLLTWRASLALRDGNRGAASAALQEALTLDPANAEALMALGRAYRAERDHGRADLLFQRASNYPETRATALVARAEVAIDQENFEAALELMRRVAAENPLSTELRRNVAVLEDLALLRTEP